MPASVKKVATEAEKPAVKKTVQKKVITKKPAAKFTTTTTTEETKTEDTKPKLTQGQKLLKSMTAQKAAKKALMKGVATTHVSFDEEGNEAKVETVINKIAPAIVTPKKTNKNRPAMKKPEKRKAEEMTESTSEETKSVEEKEEKTTETEKDQVKKPAKRAKKPKKTKSEIEEEKKDNKQEEALAYVRSFVNDRENWKFKKVQQIWLLANLYDVPEEEFDNVLEYLKDLQGSAREKAKKEAQEKIPKAAPTPVSNTLTGYAAVGGGDDDDFDAEKLLAQASVAVIPEAQAEAEDEEDEDETLEVKRARLIVNVLV